MGLDYWLQTARACGEGAAKAALSTACGPLEAPLVDVTSKHVARFTAAAASIILLNLAVVQLPRQFYFRVHRPLAAADAEPLFISGLALAHNLAPVLQKTMFAMACSLLAFMILDARDPPPKVGSHHFRIVPLASRDRQRPLRSAHQTPDTAPLLQLYKNDKAIDMPRPLLGADGILVWSFEVDLVVDEYSWITPKAADPEDDPSMWRLESVSTSTTAGQRGWHALHETDTSWADVVPMERGMPVRRRFIAPDGAIPPHSASWLGIYYRALQYPQQDRDLYASMALLRHSLLPVAVGLLTLPWLPVLHIQLSSLMGLTSITSVAAGVALTLAKGEVLENIFAGILLSAQGQLIYGDDVEISYQGRTTVSTKGRVLAIGNAFVSLEGDEGRLIQVPNRIVLGSIICSAQTLRPAHQASLRYLSRETP
eukprot:CAMPEP_0178370170 /NCGR_PEP_ID=MMETSP0689_2-20121128/161_1 /TAXON_ID=160604 /ORGANISM="Amphidinium massartii, Strain CS-259" /LENGTH=425 /DNA_ID=CAMNT_0019989977 /DNA_START=332 /DNA_END=1610 /DNA_ORIENTATION=-